jgi:hypothetical protein
MYSNKFIAKIGKRFVVTKQLNVELGIVLVESGIMDGVLVILDAGLGMIDGALGIIIAGCRRRVVFYVNPDDIFHHAKKTSYHAEKISCHPGKISRNAEKGLLQRGKRAPATRIIHHPYFIIHNS